MNSEDAFLIRALLYRMKLEACSAAVDRLSDEIMTLVAGCATMPPMNQPRIEWVGDTMVVA